MCDCLFHLWNEYSFTFVKPIIQNLISGGVLILVGYLLFKRQERFKSSTKQVQNICEQLSLYLFAYRELRFSYEILQRVSCNGRNLGNSELPEAFMGAPKQAKKIFYQILSARKLEGINQPFPDSLKQVTLLFKSMTWVYDSGLCVVVSYNTLLSVMDDIINEKPDFDLTNLKRCWNMYQTGIKQLNLVLDFLTKICDDSIWILLDRETFELELSKFESIDNELNKLELESGSLD